MKSWNSAFNAQGSRIIAVAAKVGAVKYMQHQVVEVVVVVVVEAISEKFF
jgi:hypothetical protein